MSIANKKYKCWVIRMENGWETDDRDIKELNYEEAKSLSLQGYKVIRIDN